MTLSLKKSPSPLRNHFWLRLLPQWHKIFLSHCTRTVLFLCLNLYFACFLGDFNVVFRDLGILFLLCIASKGQNISLKTVMFSMHYQKSNQNFRDITWNVEKNEILHYIFCIVSRFPRYSTFHVLSRKIDYLWDSVSSRCCPTWCFPCSCPALSGGCC